MISLWFVINLKGVAEFFLSAELTAFATILIVCQDSFLKVSTWNIMKNEISAQPNISLHKVHLRLTTLFILIACRLTTYLLWKVMLICWWNKMRNSSGTFKEAANLARGRTKIQHYFKTLAWSKFLSWMKVCFKSDLFHLGLVLSSRSCESW